MTLRTPSDTELETALAQWLPTQRWFSEKNGAIARVRIVVREPLLAADAFAADHLIILVELDNGIATRYQVPLAYRTQVPEALAPWALPPGTLPVACYDALADHDVVVRYLQALEQSQSIGALRFRRSGSAHAVPTGRSRVIGAEQSNTSVVVGESLILKLFRHIQPGINPDLELHMALDAAGCESVAHLRGWIELEAGSESGTVAIAHQFVPNGVDGWDMAMTSVRDLIAEADLHASELGSDFAGESHRLGETVAHVHADLARVLGSEPREVAIDAMRSRLDDAVRTVPEIADQRRAAEAVFDQAAAAGPTAVQRIHGDLHLGQALRTPSRWVLIDFEGEPVKTIAQRRQPDSPLRDIAGMLRSFDYAGRHPLADAAAGSQSQREFRATEWTTRNSDAFCDGYAEVANEDPRDQPALLQAYQLDKAIYEAVYEARHRPSWLPLPIRAITRLVSL